MTRGAKERGRNLIFEVFLDEFLLEKQLQGASERTLKDYEYHIRRFFRGVKSSDFEELKKKVFAYFTEPIKPATFNIRRAYLKAFFRFLVGKGVLPENPIKFKRRKDEGRARAIPVKVLEKLLKLPDKNTFAGLRNYTLILFSLDTGARPSEALSLLPKHFDLESLEVVIPREISKTRATRIVPLSETVSFWIKKLLSVRPKEWGEEVPVFCTCDGRKMKENSWNKTLERYSKKLGYKITPYDLRHSFALLSLREGMNPFALQKILGHSDLTMTKRYLALSKGDLKREHEKTSPVKLFLRKTLRKIPEGSFS